MSETVFAHRPVIQLFNRLGPICLFSIFLLLTASGCVTPTANRRQPVQSGVDKMSAEQMLRTEVRSWMGTPHRMGGMTRRGIDCSGLVVVVYDKLFDLPLPRTTTALMQTGQRVKKKNLVAGDLVFFKPGYKNRHVGIYLGCDEFAHTSTSRGVMISRMDENFWDACYLTGRRVR